MAEDVKVKVSVDMGKGDDSLEGLVKQLNAVDVAVNTVNASLGKSTSVFGKYQASVKETTRILGKLIGAQKGVAESSAGGGLDAIMKAEQQIATMKKASAKEGVDATKEAAKLEKEIHLGQAAWLKSERAKETAARKAASVGMSSFKRKLLDLDEQLQKNKSSAVTTNQKKELVKRLENINSYLKLRQARTKAAVKETERLRTLPQDSHVGAYKTALKASKKQNSLLKERSSLLGKITSFHDSIISHIFGVVAGYRLVNSVINTMLNTLRSVPQALIELQTTQSVFAATFDSEFAGASVMKALRDEAERTGISITVLRENFRNLNASMSIAGETTEDVWKVFTNMNTAITALHLSGEKAVGVFEAIQQTFNKGKVQSEELTKQLGNRLPGAFAAFAKATGRSTAQLAADMKAGLVQAHGELVKFAEFYGSTFAASMTIAGEGLQANLGRLSSEFTILAETIGVKLEEPMIALIKASTELLKSITELLKGSKALTVALNSGLGLALAVITQRLALFLKFLFTVPAAAAGTTTAIIGTSRAMALLSASMAFLTSPAGILTGIGLIGGALYGLWGAADAGPRSMGKAEEAIDDYVAKLQKASVTTTKAVKALELRIDNDPGIAKAQEGIDQIEKDLLKARKRLATAEGVNVLNLFGGDISNSKEDIAILEKRLDNARQFISDKTAAIQQDLDQKEAKRLKDKNLKAKTASAEYASSRVSETKAMLAQVNALYDLNRLSIRAYYSELSILQQRAFDERLDQLKSQYAKQAQLIAIAEDGASQILLDKQKKLQDRIFNLESQKEAQRVKTAGEGLLAQQRFNDSLLQTSQNYYTLIGSAEGAAKAQNSLLDFRIRKLDTEAFDGTDSALAAAAKAQLEYTKANTTAQALLTDSIRDTTIAEEALNNSVVRIDARRAASTQTELKSMLQRTAASQEYIDLQKEVIAQAEAEYNPIADQNGDIRRSIDEMTASLYAFQQTSNEVVVFARTTLNDALSSSFKDFITGAKSAGEAMKDFTLTVLDSIAQIAANQLANQVIGGLFDVIGLGTSGLSTSTKGLGTSATTQISGSADLAKVDLLSLLEPKPFAKGGIPDIGSSPATFAMGSLREGGTPEAIMPLQRDRKGNLGVSASGAGGGGVNIGSINVSVVEKKDSSTQEQAAAISKAVGDQLKALVQQGIASASRPGNQLNPTQIVGVF